MKENLLEKWHNYKLLISFLIVGLMTGIGILFFYQPTKAEEVPDVLTLASNVTVSSESETNEVKESSEQEEASENKVKTIMVDVKGAVLKPDLYELPVDSRVADAIKKAGGLSAEADPKSINLAQKLNDEAVVYVANMTEAISVIASSSTVSGSSHSTVGSETTGLVNINTADLSELQTITGIGAKRAQDILTYRETNGPFKTVDDLNNVSGIGDKTLENLKNYVTVD